MINKINIKKYYIKIFISIILVIIQTIIIISIAEIYSLPSRKQSYLNEQYIKNLIWLKWLNNKI